ncbi:acyl--CoA ligase [Candidatus Dependentiae bacterium]|nr:acyl--CoA ligase [Candidatus Dependentiae bacterium]
MQAEQQKFNRLYKEIFDHNQIMFVGKLLQRAAKKWPTNIAVICQDKKITYEELYLRSVDLSIYFKSLGLSARDRVILYYENSIEFYVGYFGAWQCGAVVAALNVFLKEAELEHVIKDCQPKIIITSKNLKEKTEAALKAIQLDIKIFSEIDVEKNISQEIAKDFKVEKIEPDEMAALLYTSGTTGMPKGVMLSSKNILTNVIQGIAKLDVSPKDRVYCALPLFHAIVQNSCIWGICFLGGTVIVIPKIDRRYIRQGLEHKPSVMVGVPALFGLFCLMKDLNFDFVRFFFSGGDALPDKIRQMFSLIYRRKICNGYGLTETTPLVCVDMDDVNKPTDTVGRPVQGVEIKVTDEFGDEINPENVGTLWVKGDNVMLGYYNAPEATKKILVDGWLNTGDLGYIDKNGKIVLTGREKDLIVQKGIKIYPQEVENVIMSYPSVIQVGVIGLDVKTDGQVPVAFISVRDLNEPDLEQKIRDLCIRSLAPYKVPRQYIFKKELPTTSTGKVDKKVLRAELNQDK